MVPVAAFAASTARRWRWLPGAAGSVFLCVPAVGVASAELGSTVAWSAMQWVGAVLVAVAIFATIAGVPIVVVRLVDSMLGRRAVARLEPSLA